MVAGEHRQQPHEKQTTVVEYTTELPVGKFADLLIRLHEEGVEGVSAEYGAEECPEGGADLRASQYSVGDDR